jgi:hypothetical protein
MGGSFVKSQFLKRAGSLGDLAPVAVWKARPCTHKIQPNVRFRSKATELPRCSEMRPCRRKHSIRLRPSLERRPTSALDGFNAPRSIWLLVVPARDQKGTRCVGEKLPQCRGCPRNCTRRVFGHSATGSDAPGKAAGDSDPRARRSATGNGHARARRAGCPGELSPVGVRSA